MPTDRKSLKSVAAELAQRLDAAAAATVLARQSRDIAAENLQDANARVAACEGVEAALRAAYELAVPVKQRRAPKGGE